MVSRAISDETGHLPYVSSGVMVLCFGYELIKRMLGQIQDSSLIRLQTPFRHNYRVTRRADTGGEDVDDSGKAVTSCHS